MHLNESSQPPTRLIKDVFGVRHA